MAIREPNHICKNINCPNGINGEPKHYYACNYCDRSNQWRSMACSIECYEAYMQQIAEARSKNKKVDILPDRTDMNKEEVKELLEQPIEKVMEDTKEELKEYLDDETTIAQAIETINSEIDSNRVHSKKNKKIAK
jgi:hypothetical protein